MTWVFFQSLISGVLAGGVYALFGVGITIIFGVMKMVDFSACAQLVWGMYFTYLFYSWTGLNCYWAIPFVVVCMGALSWVIFKLIVRPLLGSDDTSFILVTLGLSYFLQNLAEFVFGADPKSVPSEIKTSSIIIGDYSIGPVSYTHLDVYKRQALSHGMGIEFQEDLVERNMNILSDLPPETTTSMQRDVLAHHQSEMDGLVYEVVRLGRKYGVSLPTYEKAAEYFREHVEQ